MTSKAFLTGGCPSRVLPRLNGLGKAPQSHVLSAKSAPSTRQGRGCFCIEARAAAVGMGVWATKAGMTSIFTPEGLCLPATVLALEEGNIVTQVKTTETHGYNAVQVGYQVVPERKITKPQLNHLKKSGAPAMRKLKEYRLKEVESYEPGQQLDPNEIFNVGEMVDVAGTTVGKGFQGTIKKWHHHRGSMTHGSKSKRQHGSIGSSATPSRVLPGLKMAGQLGNKRRTIKGLEVLMVDTERGALVVKGSVPGKPGCVVEITPGKIVGKNC
ncbi:hypothetical protein CVIRNUC_001535 [Coccomyxa viridis]|uniref:Large ribosomal subunit protein uL3c n=1 Tax=Coccomyxa viridis TaxID=1274662 RepID=A0AAV1HW80_9CHLO|nr:hypothetical protein CVIRNUC_001535 [Coccomyxa viridis]